MSDAEDFAFYAGIGLIAYSAEGPIVAGMALILTAFLDPWVTELAKR